MQALRQQAGGDGLVSEIRCSLAHPVRTEHRPCEVQGCEGHDRTIWRLGDGTETDSVWNAPPGTMWVGDTFKEHAGERSCAWGWTNCDGRHVRVILPTGEPFDCMRRASNCGLPDDTTHRCWVVHGEPPDITLDKNGHTCVAGAGSIAAGGWHGFLREGLLVLA